MSKDLPPSLSKPTGFEECPLDVWKSLKRKTDFHCLVATVRQRAYRHAARNGLYVETEVVGKTVLWVKFSKDFNAGRGRLKY